MWLFKKKTETPTPPLDLYGVIYLLLFFSSLSIGIFEILNPNPPEMLRVLKWPPFGHFNKVVIKLHLFDRNGKS